MVPTPASFVRLFFVVLAWPALTFAQNVNVTVNASQTVRTVDERVFGANSVIWDPQASSPLTISMLQTAGLRTVRVPGGSLSDEYHWRVNKTLSNTWTWSSHFGKFVELISSLSANAVVTVNYGTGTPEEAAALVAYLNSPVGSNVAIGSDGTYDWGNSGTWAAVRASQVGPADDMTHLRVGRSAPLGAKYFEIGNECYGSWETDQQAVKNDPTTYANRAQQYMTKMRAVDPGIKIGVVVVTSSENASYKNWTPVMLARLKVLNAIPDFIIYHRYPQAPAIDQPNNPESDAVLLQNAATWAGAATDLRNQLNTHLGASGAGVEIMVTENNSVYANPGKQSTSLVNGLYLADSVANVMKSEINGFMWWAVRNGPPATANTNQSASLYGWRMYGDYGMISTPFSEGATTYQTSYYDPHPTYYAMKLLQYFARQGDQVVTATSSSNLLSVFAARRGDGSLTLLVLNKDPNNALTANIGISGFTPGATATVYSFGKPQDDARRFNNGSTDIAVTSQAVAGTNFSAAFGSYSMTVLNLNPAPTGVAPAITTQPVSQTVMQGAAATFTAAASGTPTPTFQWKKNGVAIAGATGTSYTIASAQPGDAGSYTVVATNSSGSATSNAATLTVTPVAARGDLDGDGKADLIWQNRITGERSFWLMNGPAFGSGFAFWTVDPSWQIVGSGDFDGDGQNDLVWTNTLTGERSIWLMNGTTFRSGISLNTVPLDWQIAAIGDFNTDGKSDLVWQNTRTGESSVWLMNGGSFTGVALNTVPPEWQIVSSGDFNADGKADLVWTNTSTGERAIWLMNGTSLASGVSLGTVAKIWQIVGSGDYNGDGNSDLVWTNIGTGERTIWLMDGTNHSSTVAVGTVTVDWVLGRTQAVPAPVQSDFTGDGNSDLVWQNLTTGERSIRIMNGTSFGSEVPLSTIPTDWRIVASGDFNADGKSDIVWANTTTGERSFWLMNGTSFNYGVGLGTIPTEWQIVASGDYNGDGKSDLVWSNTTTGERSIWLMNGTSYMAGAALTTVPTNWQIVASGDFNADGKSDLVWTDTSTGERSIWFMDGTAFSSGVSLGIVPLNLEIVGTGDFNADGKSDLVWTDTSTGERTIWLMDGATHSNTVSLGIIPTDRQIRN